MSDFKVGDRVVQKWQQRDPNAMVLTIDKIAGGSLQFKRQDGWYNADAYTLRIPRGDEQMIHSVKRKTAPTPIVKIEGRGHANGWGGDYRVVRRPNGDVLLTMKSSNKEWKGFAGDIMASLTLQQAREFFTLGLEMVEEMENS